MSECRSLVFDRVAHCYDATRGGESRGARIASDLEPWLAGGPVLEVGVGTGLVAAPLADRGHPVFGIDLSPAMLALAAARLGTGRLALADARALPVADGAVSTVVFVHALHAIGDVSAALAEAFRVVRPGGRVVATHGGATDEPTDISEAMSPSEPLHTRIDRPDAVLAAGRATGLALVWTGDTAPTPDREGPRELAQLVRDRAFAWLWEVDDAAWAQYVAPALERLAALPDQDRPREFLRRHRVTVWDRPPA
ncbi:MAG TPA: class I SAM-dependent methyltransferase [Micromonosporaceae bacterium]|nr:class I SAM-dependent methyltransferase [Micromonosporaceae bacterium]